MSAVDNGQISRSTHGIFMMAFYDIFPVKKGYNVRR